MRTHNPEDNSTRRNLYRNLEIADIVKKERAVDPTTLAFLCDKSIRAVRRWASKAESHGEIVKCRRGKYTLYVWNDQSNVFIKHPELILDFDAGYNLLFQKWYLRGLVSPNGEKFFRQQMKKMDKKLKILRRKGTKADKRIIKYVKKGFFNYVPRRYSSNKYLA